MKNKYGLSRGIPSEIARQVRRYCGFGCVICGASIFEYEHVEPPFAEAKEHNPDRITLLCHQCHGKVTRKFLSKDTVKEAMKRPFCKRAGYASEFLDIGRTSPKVVFGGVTLTNCDIPIEVNGTPLFEIKEAEEAGGPFRLSANFYNSHGTPSLQIIDNEWRALDSNWDVETVGGVITIRDAPRHVSLALRSEPPDGVVVEHLDMLLQSLHFLGNRHELTVVSPSGESFSMTGCIADDNRVGLAIE